MGFTIVGQAGLELLTWSDLPASASQSAGMIGVSHCAWPPIQMLMMLSLGPGIFLNTWSAESSPNLNFPGLILWYLWLYVLLHPVPIQSLQIQVWLPSLHLFVPGSPLSVTFPTSPSLEGLDSVSPETVTLNSVDLTCCGCFTSFCLIFTRGV